MRKLLLAARYFVRFVRERLLRRQIARVQAHFSSPHSSRQLSPGCGSPSKQVSLLVLLAGHLFISSMVVLILRLFSETLAEFSLFFPTKTDSTAPLGLKKFMRLAAGIVMIAILGKQNVDYMTGKRNISKRWRATAILLPLLIIWPKQVTRLIKWNHFDIWATGQSDIHCKIKETVLIHDLKPALNENVASEKLLLY